MIRLFLFSICFLCFTGLSAQTELFSENFNGASSAFQLNTSDMGSVTAGDHLWIINNAYAGGSINAECMGFPISVPIVATPNQPGGVTGGPQSKYMHVVTQWGISAGIVNSHYMAVDGTCYSTSENIFTKMSSDFSTVGYTNITLSFWWLCAPNLAFGEVYYSTNGGSSWTLVPSMPPINSKESWTFTSVVIPAFLNQPTLRLGFRFVNGPDTDGKDPAFGIDDIKITGVSAVPSTITTGAVVSGNYCPGDAIDLPFAVSGPFNAGNVFTAQLSDASGNFTSPVSIGTLNGTNNGVINCTIPNGTPAGTYKFRVVSSNPEVEGSVGPVSVNISAAPTALILPGSTTSICSGGVAVLNASGGGDYQWYSSPSGSGFTPISGATSSTYTSAPLNSDMYYQVKVTNDCGESTSASWQVKLQTVVNIPLQANPASLNLCSGQVTLTVQGTFSNLVWSNGETGTSVSLDSPVTITVSGTDPNGCPAESDAVDVVETEPLPLTISPSSPVTLCGASVNLTASTGFSDYQWSGGGTGNPYAATEAGVYSVTATDANGCESVSEPVTVVEGDTAIIEITPANPAICPGEPVELVASEGFSSYVWSNGQTSRSIVVNQSGTYSVVGAPLGGGCPGISSPVTVSKSNFPIANFSYTQSNGMKITFENTSQNGVEYSWSFSTFGTSTAESPSFSFTELGAYYVTLVASNGCGTDSVTKLVIVTDVGFETWLKQAGLSIFPNPSASDFHIACPASICEQLTMDCFDLSGRSLGMMQGAAGSTPTRLLPASTLSPGIYLLRIRHQDGRTALFRLVRTAW